MKIFYLLDIVCCQFFNRCVRRRMAVGGFCLEAIESIFPPCTSRASGSVSDIAEYDGFAAQYDYSHHGKLLVFAENVNDVTKERWYPMRYRNFLVFKQVYQTRDAGLGYG